MFKKGVVAEVVIKGLGFALAVGVLAIHAGIATAQQNYPSRQIRFIVPFPPGGTTTPPARIVGQKLAERWGQQVIIDNRGGGNTVIGTQAAMNAAPDGYTILLATPSFVTLPSLAKVPFDPIKDFAPVATIVSGENILVAHPSVAANNLKELIALAKSKPGQLNYGLPGNGGIVHLTSELFKSVAGVDILGVPYTGGAPMITDLMGGRIQVAFQGPLSVMEFVKTGQLKGIAVSGSSRQPQLPQVPTFAEAGLPNFEGRYWNGIVAPAGTPKAIIDRLSAEVASILADAEVKQTLSNLAQPVYYSNPEQTAALIKTDVAKFAKVIKDANIRIDQ